MPFRSPCLENRTQYTQVKRVAVGDKNSLANKNLLEYFHLSKYDEITMRRPGAAPVQNEWGTK